MTRSSTFTDKTSPLTAYIAKPSFTRAAAYKGGGGVHGRSIPETWGDVLIRDLCESHTDTIIGVRFVDSDVDTYVKEGMDMIFPKW